MPEARHIVASFRIRHNGRWRERKWYPVLQTDEKATVLRASSSVFCSAMCCVAMYPLASGETE
jgi:hypothetical protein